MYIPAAQLVGNIRNINCQRVVDTLVLDLVQCFALFQNSLDND